MRRRVRGGLAGKRVEYLLHKERARALARERISHFNAAYNFAVGKIAIRNQRSRWGSASERGNLNFHYKIALLPVHLADYIIVHELCHLGAFNHSREFWSLVSRTIPDHKKRRREVKEKGRPGRD